MNREQAKLAGAGAMIGAGVLLGAAVVVLLPSFSGWFAMTFPESGGDIGRNTPPAVEVRPLPNPDEFADALGRYNPWARQPIPITKDPKEDVTTTGTTPPPPPPPEDDPRQRGATIRWAYLGMVEGPGGKFALVRLEDGTQRFFGEGQAQAGGRVMKITPDTIRVIDSELPDPRTIDRRDPIPAVEGGAMFAAAGRSGPVAPTNAKSNGVPNANESALRPGTSAGAAERERMLRERQDRLEQIRREREAAGNRGKS